MWIRFGRLVKVVLVRILIIVRIRLSRVRCCRWNVCLILRCLWITLLLVVVSGLMRLYGVVRLATGGWVMRVNLRILRSV